MLSGRSHRPVTWSSRLPRGPCCFTPECGDAGSKVRNLPKAVSGGAGLGEEGRRGHVLSLLVHPGHGGLCRPHRSFLLGDQRAGLLRGSGESEAPRAARQSGQDPGRHAVAGRALLSRPSLSCPGRESVPARGDPAPATAGAGHRHLPRRLASGIPRAGRCLGSGTTVARGPRRLR